METPDRANDRNLTGVVLWVLEGNERAIEFFARCGFVPEVESIADIDSAGERLTELRMRHKPGAQQGSTAHGI